MQKLFIINYNNKKFRIFIDEEKRKTFLEIDKNGEYDYPSLEDFTYLHNIYNNYNYFNCYDIRDYFYKEKVRIASGLLSVVVALNSIPGVMAKSNIEVTNEGVSISENKEVVVSIKDSKALDSLLGSLNPKKEEVKKAIEDNSNLNSYVKIKMKK